jgi:hypothetical protein
MRHLNCLLMFCVLFLTCGLAVGQCAPCTIWTPSSTPAIADSGDTASIELGVKFRADSNGYVTGVRFYKSVANGGTHTGNLWTSSGVLLATAQFSGESASGWQQVTFTTPVLISSGTTYVVSYFTHLGHYAFDANFFATSGVDNAPLHALANGVDGSNAVFSYGSTSSFPSSSYKSTNYWVDVVYVPQGSMFAPTVTATSPSNGDGGVATNISVTAKFSEPMDATTISSSSFQLVDANSNAVAGTVSYNSATTTLLFQPSAALSNARTYTATVRGTVKDAFGNAMGADFNWSFATQPAQPPGFCPCSLWGPNAAPGLADSGEAAAVELGVKFQSDLDGYITGIRFYKSGANGGTHIGNLWTANGALLGSATFTGESASGWQQVTFSSPVPISAGTTYVASYFASTGHYALDQNFFAVGFDNAPLHALASGTSGGNGVYVYSLGSTFPTSSYNASNYWVDVVYTPKYSTIPPIVTGTTPGNGSMNISLAASVSARFSEPMDPATLTSSNFQLIDSSNNVVSGTITYVTGTATMVFQPMTTLVPQTTYTATVRGGVRDVFGNALGADFSWSFTTAPPPADSGPGGPILVIASAANPFSRYYGEILLAEGMNEFLIKDISTITPAVLNQYDVAILGDMNLTATQASMISSWVNNGGNLIAMHPDQQLAGLLGLAPVGTTLSDSYLVVNGTSGPGVGIVTQSMQFHGMADLYSLNGATSIATLYSNASTPTSSPAVTLSSAGAGQAAAFTYDLARSVVLLRQGNPAWSGQDRDGFVDPGSGTTEIRANDLFYGNALFDPEPDWVNLDKVQIPQADEQQRLLVNLIEQMNLNHKPLPRFWYLPSGFKAAVIMTGDDHGGNGTQPRFDTYIAESPANCSVNDWTCVRATSYIFPNNVTIPNYQDYVSQGFEIANHTDNVPTCTTFTPASLDAAITTQLAEMAQKFPSNPPSKTNRTHCVLWSDYDSEPTILLNHGIRLDTSYYYWPDLWVQGRPGMFTGSGMPMRYADRNGNTIDVYQATTQFPDETTWNFPADIDRLLNNADGPQGFYGVFTANMHTDNWTDPESDAIVASAQAHGAPIIAAQQMLTWLDGRNSSTLSKISWAANTLSFTVTAASGVRNLEVMVPTNSASASATLTGITLAGLPVNYSLQTIKGIQYAAFLTTGGAYQAVYGGTTYSLSGTISGAGGNLATVTLGGAAAATTTADASGNYTFSGLANGGYTVTPSKTGYTFTPTSQNVTVSGANVTAVNFSTATVTYSISGTISGAGGNGATVALSGAASGTVTADASGNYTFSGLANGAYTVTPSKTGYTFTPTGQNVTVSGANVTAVNFSSAAVTYSMSGTISGAGGNAATVTLGGAATATTTANSSGNYSFSGLVSGAYTVTPTKTGYTFTPATQNVTVNGGNVTAVNFSSVGSPSVQLSPTSVNFGIVLDFSTSSTSSVTVRNTGTATLTISSITITGTNAADFQISSKTCGTTLAVNSTCTVSVRFTPQAAGARAAALTFTDSAANSPHSVALSGTGTMVSVSPTSITFAARTVGTTSGASNVTLRNVGPGGLTISGITITGTNPGDFSQTSNCGASLARNGSCTIAVRFKPTAIGTRTATLRVDDSDPTSPELVTLTGTGQ